VLESRSSTPGHWIQDDGSRRSFDGRDDEAAATWREMLLRNACSALARSGPATAAYRKGNRVIAKDEYGIARSIGGALAAFGDRRREVLRVSLGRVVPLFVLGARVVTSTSRRTVDRLITVRIELYGGPA
jgi:hypothetical protein